MKLFLLSLVFTTTAFGGETVWKIVWKSWRGSRVVLLTGFGPFGTVTDNPSERIVLPLKEEIERKCQPRDATIEAKVLEVVPGAIETVLTQKYKTIVSMGVHGGTTGIRLETAARNHFYDPDTGADFAIDPALPKTHVLYGPPLPDNIPSLLEGFDVVRGDETSAGTYVCNDTFYRLCRSERAGYFVHVPRIEPSEDGRLIRAMGEIACKIFYLHEVS